jgi:transcriptional regulator with XRE-family HTH domain
MEQCRFPNRLKKYRRYFSFSQKDVADVLGLTDTSPLSRWEKGLVFPNISHLFRLCRLYKTMPQELYAELWDNVTVEVSKAQVSLLARKEQIISNKVYHL